MGKHEKTSVKSEEKKWYVDEMEDEEPKISDIIIGATYIVASVGVLVAFIYMANKNLR